MLYPFGYGLSYTAFAISDALVKKQNGGILVTADVKNIGEMSGKEVIRFICLRYIQQRAWSVLIRN